MTAAEQARKLHADARSAYARIDADTRLSEAARREDKIRTWSRLTQDLAHLQADEQHASRQRKVDLERQLFGLPKHATSFDVVSHRDAAERANAIRSESEATRVMASAAAQGDHQLASAIASRAIHENWQRLVDAYVADIRPDAGPLIAELVQPDYVTLQSEVLNGFEFIAANPPGLERESTFTMKAEASKLGVPVTSTPPAGPAIDLLSQLFAEHDARQAARNDTDETAPA